MGYKSWRRRWSAGYISASMSRRCRRDSKGSLRIWFMPKLHSWPSQIVVRDLLWSSGIGLGGIWHDIKSHMATDLSRMILGEILSFAAV